MSRILYCAAPTGAITGGQKMWLRHVETLRDLGFDAHYRIGAQSKVPDWLEYSAKVEVGVDFRPDDIVVLGDDMHDSIRRAHGITQQTVIIFQNQYIAALLSLDALHSFPPERFPRFITVGQSIARSVGRLYPQASIDLVPCFADERLFRPGAERSHRVALSPAKRALEAGAIRGFFRHLHPAHAATPWVAVKGATERQVATTFGSSSLFLSLSRLESVGMTPLEAMACGCICAGFTGIGGREYATADNGFWVGEDDCEAAADALAEAADVVLTGGAALRHRLEAGAATAAQWSYVRFRTALEEVWMRLAPQARLKDGPLD